MCNVSRTLVPRGPLDVVVRERKLGNLVEHEPIKTIGVDGHPPLSLHTCNFKVQPVPTMDV